MKYTYKLVHKRVVEIDNEGDKVCSTKLLGFFSSQDKCKNIIPLYLQQPGFKDFPDDFVIEQIEADIDEFNEVIGEFKSSVFYLSHEYFDGEFDHISDLGYYSTYQIAAKRKIQYQLEPEYIDHLDGFCIDEYKIDVREWTEGFFTY